MLPSLDKFHTPGSRHIEPEGIFDVSAGRERWLEFLKRTGIEVSVLFPAAGISQREVEDGGLALGREPIDYFRSGRVFVGCEGNEDVCA